MPVYIVQRRGIWEPVIVLRLYSHSIQTMTVLRANSMIVKGAKGQRSHSKPTGRHDLRMNLVLLLDRYGETLMGEDFGGSNVGGGERQPL